jgi:glucan phosphorylase
LAESLVDSLATLDMPAWGYGLRFMYGNLKEYTKALKKHQHSLDDSIPGFNNHQGY